MPVADHQQEFVLEDRDVAATLVPRGTRPDIQVDKALDRACRTKEAIADVPSTLCTHVCWRGLVARGIPRVLGAHRNTGCDVEDTWQGPCVEQALRPVGCPRQQCSTSEGGIQLPVVTYGCPRVQGTAASVAWSPAIIRGYRALAAARFLVHFMPERTFMKHCMYAWRRSW